MKVFVIVGTRPEAIKMAPVYKELSEADGLEPILISTGQHREMLDQVLNWFSLRPDYGLELMTPNQTLNGVMSKAISGLDELIEKENPDAILAQGDTATVCAAALSAFNRGVPFGHVEAGLRTRNLNQPFPEEGYRQMVSRVATWHFCPTQKSYNALGQEIVAGKKYLVGNTVVDALLDTARRVGEPETQTTRNKLVLITGHRRENHGSRFDEAFQAISELARNNTEVDFVYPVHLNPNVKNAAFDYLNDLKNVTLIKPVAYPEMIALMKKADLILTDSGGVQEEAPTFGVPVLVMRDTTERQEAITAGVCELVGTSKDRIVSRGTAILSGLDDKFSKSTNNPFGDGLAAQRISRILLGQEISNFTAVE